MEVEPLDEHPEDRGKVAEHQAGQQTPAHPRLNSTEVFRETLASIDNRVHN